MTWAFVLYQEGAGANRLVTRLRGSWRLRDTNPLSWPFSLLFELGASIMERRMLREIRRLAEREAAA